MTEERNPGMRPLLNVALAKRRRSRRARALLILTAGLAVLAGFVASGPFSWVLYAAAVAAIVGAAFFHLSARSATQLAASTAAAVHVADPSLEILPTLPKPVASQAATLISTRSAQ